MNGFGLAGQLFVALGLGAVAIGGVVAFRRFQAAKAAKAVAAAAPQPTARPSTMPRFIQPSARVANIAGAPAETDVSTEEMPSNVVPLRPFAAQ